MQLSMDAVLLQIHVLNVCIEVEGDGITMQPLRLINDMSADLITEHSQTHGVTFR